MHDVEDKPGSLLSLRSRLPNSQVEVNDKSTTKKTYVVLVRREQSWLLTLPSHSRDSSLGNLEWRHGTLS